MLHIEKNKFNIRTMFKINTKKPSIKLISDNDKNKDDLSNQTPEPVPVLTDMEFNWIEDY